MTTFGHNKKNTIYDPTRTVKRSKTNQRERKQGLHYEDYQIVCHSTLDRCLNKNTWSKDKILHVTELYQRKLWRDGNMLNMLKNVQLCFTIKKIKNSPDTKHNGSDWRSSYWRLQQCVSVCVTLHLTSRHYCDCPLRVICDLPHDQESIHSIHCFCVCTYMCVKIRSFGNHCWLLPFRTAFVYVCDQIH